MSSDVQTPLRIRTFGRFEIEREGTPLDPGAWPRRMTRTLLKVLLTGADRVFTKDQLIDALLPEADLDHAVRNLQARISELRRVLEPDLKRGADSSFVKRVGEGYLFHTDSVCWLDSLVFEQELREAATLLEESRRTAVTRLEDTLALYRGEFLAEDRYESWAEPRRAHLKNLYLDALLDLADAYAELGRLRQSITCCQRVLSVEPYRERAIRQLMEFHAAVGQRSAALRVYEEGARTLRELLDVGPSRDTQALHERLRAEPAMGIERLDIRRVAVLPLDSYGSGTNDGQFADGMTEELIGCLSRLADLRVVARTSVMRYKGTEKPVSQIVRELRVGTILEGSVRNAAGKLRVSIQMIDGRSEEHLWARDYDCTLDDVLRAQRDIALDVAAALQLELLPREEDQLGGCPVADSEAYVLFLKGRHFFNRRSYAVLPKAIECFRSALELDPDYAQAHVGLALCHAHLAGIDLPGNQAYTLARDELETALALQPDLAEAHAAMALIEWGFRGASQDAEARCKRAIALNPSHAQAHDWYALVLLMDYRIDEAVGEARRALELDPLSPVYHCSVARALISANRFREAEDILMAAKEVDPTYSQADKWLALSLQLTGRWHEAEAAIERFLQTTSRPAALQFRAQQRLYTGRVDESVEILEAVVAASPGVIDAEMSLCIALYHAHRFAEVVKRVHEAIATHPLGVTVAGQAPLRLLLGLAYDRLERTDDALREFAAAGTRLPPWADSLLIQGHQHVLVAVAGGIANARGGREATAREVLERLAEHGAEREAPSALACLCFALGDTDEGFVWLDRAVDCHDRLLLTALSHPWFDAVRADPRFDAVLRRLHLPA